MDNLSCSKSIDEQERGEQSQAERIRGMSSAEAPPSEAASEKCAQELQTVASQQGASSDVSFLPGAYHQGGRTDDEVDQLERAVSFDVGASHVVSQSILLSSFVTDAEPPIAVAVSSEEPSKPPIVTATPDNFLRHLRHNRKTQIIVLCVAGLLLTLVVTLGVTLARSSSIEVPPGFFSKVHTFDGQVHEGQFGSSISMSADGTRLAVGTPGVTDSSSTRAFVQVYERNETGHWVDLGPPIDGSATDTTSDSSVAELAVRSPLAVALSRDGRTLAIGSPLHDIGSQINVGQVEVFHFSSSRMWERLGDPIVGTSGGDLFGASVAMSEDGAIVAIGSPGSYANTGVVKVYQLNTGNWIERGTQMVGIEPDSLFGSSVTLSSDGKTLGVGGSTLPFEEMESGIVVRSFSYFGDWTELGSGVMGREMLHETVYQAALSSDGTILVISNYYANKAGDPSYDYGESNESLDVRAFKLQGDVWESLGLPLHYNLPGKKSGYVIALSENGHAIAMGDPGTHGLGGGASSGHAHIYLFNGDEWQQIGPNVLGENAGDLFGFSVALSGDGKRFVAGAPFSRGNGFEHGRVQIFEYEA